MSDKITADVQQIVKESQAKADEIFSGDSRTTNVTLWDDGDFKVDVVHGYDGRRDHIVWRSSSSQVYPAKEFLFIVDTVLDTEGTEELHREIV